VLAATTGTKVLVDLCCAVVGEVLSGHGAKLSLGAEVLYGVAKCSVGGICSRGADCRVGKRSPCTALQRTKETATLALVVVLLVSFTCLR